MRIIYKTNELKEFWNWINERHLIYIKKEARVPWPWTRDKILQTYRFTNVFRQLDRVTREWAIRYDLMNARSQDEIFFFLCMFRLFNWPPTFDALMLDFKHRSEGRWNPKVARLTCARRTRKKLQLFTGAYIVSSGGERQAKYLTIIDALDEIYRDRHILTGAIMGGRSLRIATELLQKYNTVGPFVAYEIACDLRFTRLMFGAVDTLTWANAGPGAMRGIHRLLTGKAKRPKDWCTPDYLDVMRDLLKRAPAHLEPHVRDCQWPFELREIEHSLCEYDKARRAARREGRPRSLYHPQPAQRMTKAAKQTAARP